MTFLAALACLLFMYMGIGSCQFLRESCSKQGVFYRVFEDMVLQWTAIKTAEHYSINQCIQECLNIFSCHSINIMIGNSKVSCEFLPLNRGNTTKLSFVKKKGWSYYDGEHPTFKVGSYCLGHSFNPCFPCKCFDSCTLQYSCLCDKGLTYPTVHISFDHVIQNQRFAYSRGFDATGNNQVTLLKEASLQYDAERKSQVLLLNGTNAGAKIGDFDFICINNIVSDGGSIGLVIWVKFLEASGIQSIVSSSGPDDTGLRLLYDANDNKIIGSISKINAIYSVRDRLDRTIFEWNHFALLFSSGVVDLYLNGQLLKNAVKTSYSTTLVFTKAITGFGVVGDDIPSLSNGKTSRFKVDEFAFWCKNVGSKAIVDIYSRSSH